MHKWQAMASFKATKRIAAFKLALCWIRYCPHCWKASFGSIQSFTILVLFRHIHAQGGHTSMALEADLFEDKSDDNSKALEAALVEDEVSSRLLIEHLLSMISMVLHTSFCLVLF